MAKSFVESMLGEKVKPAETVKRFAAETGIALLPGDLYLGRVRLVLSGPRHQLTVGKTKSELLLRCEPFSYRTTHWINVIVAVVTVVALAIGAAVGADFASVQISSILLLGVVGCAVISYGLVWMQNRAVAGDDPMIRFDARTGRVNVKNGQFEVERDDVLCLILMNSVSRRGRSETSAFQLKIVTTRLQENHHEEFVILQNAPLPLELYHETVGKFASALKVPLVECQYGHRGFTIRRIT